VRVRDRLCLAAALCALAALATGSGGQAYAKSVRFKAQKAPFVIGVWKQPSYSFAKWRARGINTVVAREALGGTVSFATWNSELARQGMRSIREPDGDRAQDARDPSLLAWLAADGPDSEPFVSPATLKRRYRSWKRDSPRTPVLLNFCGACVLYRNHPERTYRAWIGAADWLSNDLYPVTGNGRPDWIDRGKKRRPPMGAVLDKLRSWSRGKRQLEIVEASDQGARHRRAATPAELRGMVWHSIIHGASGIVYFPQRVHGGFEFDATPPRLAAEMTRIDRSIARLAPVLLSRGARTPAPAPFERATRIRGHHVYTIVLNLSHRAARYHGRRYRPFEVRVVRR
jgi:hypothetical protein